MISKDYILENRDYLTAVASQLFNMKYDLKQIIKNEDWDGNDVNSILSEIAFRADRLTEEIEKHLD